ncbi:MAG: aldo/keto reductase [Anaerofustis stercorihominis]|nr:aldo/keto reductase [Anaerofustis stercorihominis]
MQKRKLGKTGLVVSLLGVGGIPLQRFDEDNAYNILKAAVENDVNFVDTAKAYTTSESLIGSAMAKIGRDKFVLASKSKSRDYESMKNDIQTSLEALQTGYIDLYQCHCVASDAEIEQIFSENGAYKALEEAKAAGKIGHIGFSAHKKEIALKLIETGKFETVQYAFNYIEVGGKDVLEAAQKCDMGTIIMKPMGGGAIKNRELSLRYIGKCDAVSVMIPGVDDNKQLIENVSFVKNIDKEFTQDELNTINAEVDILGDKFCRKCDYCQPCPNGINISNILMLDGYFTRYGLEDWAKSRYDGSAADCAECGECESKCPYELPIIEMLKAAHGKMKH